MRSDFSESDTKRKRIFLFIRAWMERLLSWSIFLLVWILLVPFILAWLLLPARVKKEWSKDDFYF